MLKAINLVRPLIGLNLVTKLSPIVATNLPKREIHITTKKLGGGDQEFIVSFK